MIGVYIAIAAVFLLVLSAFIVKDIVKRKKLVRIGNVERYNVKKCIAAYLFFAPALVMMILFIFLPIVFSLAYGFTDYYLLRPNDVSFVKFDNFISIFKDFGAKGDTYYAFLNTLQFILYEVPLQVAAALGLALIANKAIKGMSVFKVLFFAPVATSLVVTSYLWCRILAAGEYGLLNSFLIKLGFEAQDFLLDPDQSMFYLIFITAWQGAGYQMLIFLSGLKNINLELYEAARLDGAGAGKLFLNITLPSLKSTMGFILLTVFVGAAKTMIQPMLMTGKTDYTITINYLMYIEGFQRRWIGYSSAMALIMTVFMGIVTLIQRRVLRDDD